jgi:UDP-N-acetylenolpyruvoylglucosamine reductase
VIVLPYEPLHRHTALRTGGPCGALVYAHDDDELGTVVRDARRADWKLRVLGAGTRVVVRDGGLPDTVVVRLAGALERVDVDPDGAWVVGAGALMPAVVAEAARVGHAGLEARATVPGTLGASLLHDGRDGRDQGWDDVVDEVYVLSRDVRRSVAWRELKEGAVVLGVRLRLRPDAPAAVAERTAAAWRAQLPVPPGSRYRLPTGHKTRKGARPEGVRRLLTSVTLPLVRLRGIAVPALAPELLCNLGSGTAADAALLQKSAVERVEKARGIDVESCIEWIGVDPPARG